MKFLLALVIMFSASQSFAAQVDLKGEEAQNVFDSIMSIEELTIFSETRMEKTSLWIETTNCFKNIFPSGEKTGCSFYAFRHNYLLTTTLASDRSNQQVTALRNLLAKATGAEVQVSNEFRQLRLKDIKCMKVENETTEYFCSITY